MGQPSLSDLATGFEGCEKKLEIDFRKSGNLRQITRLELDELLEDAKCTIISCTKNDHFDSYVLSESSLFVFPSKIILKTCGTTSLLHCLPKLLAAAERLGTEPEFVQFSRSNFMFPEKQPYPHRSFSLEVQYLNTFFDGGHAYILGPINGPRWHLYLADMHMERNGDGEQTLELVMFNLDTSIMRTFYNGDAEQNAEREELKGDTELPRTGPEATHRSGIDTIIPGATIDSFLFSPCGYSCNALKDDVYFTIHITPEPECSFVSFETNLRLESYAELIQHVVGLFKPESFCVSLFVDENSLTKDASRGLGWAYDGYNRKGRTFHKFEGSYNTASGQFVSVAPSTNTRYGRSAFKAAANNGSGAAKPEITQQVSVGNYTEEEMAQFKLTEVDEESLSRFSVPYHLASKLAPHHLASLAVAAVKQQATVEAVRAEDMVRPGRLIQKIVEREEPEEAFFLIDIGQIVKRFADWCRLFPRVIPFYSVKCNGDPGVIRALHALGCGFSCTNVAEIKSLLAVGVPAHRITINNPWKPESQLRFAAERHVDHMTFDNLNELKKIRKFYPEAKLLLCVGGEQTTAPPPVPSAHAHGPPNPRNAAMGSIKRQGCSLEQVHLLLTEAKRLGANVTGVSMALPTDVATAAEFRTLIRDAKYVFTKAEEVFGHPLKVLDIGSAFPDEIQGNKAHDMHLASMSELAEVINHELDTFFPNVRILASPSRYLLTPSHTLAVTVISRRRVTLPAKPVAKDAEVAVVPGPADHKADEIRDAFLYYINDGIYGSFNCLLYDRKKVIPHLVAEDIAEDQEAGRIPAAGAPPPADDLPTDASDSSDAGSDTEVPKHDEAIEYVRPPTPPFAKPSYANRQLFNCTIFGPTCDGIDCVIERDLLPELKVGDWLYFTNMGAFTVSAATAFNGFDPPKIRYINTFHHA